VTWEYVPKGMVIERIKSFLILWTLPGYKILSHVSFSCCFGCHVFGNFRDLNVCDLRTHVSTKIVRNTATQAKVD
jgi:hypothetical protein